jgi:hypothetical protein
MSKRRKARALPEDELTLALQVIIASEDYRPMDGLDLAREQVRLYQRLMIRKTGRFGSQISSSRRSTHPADHQERSGSAPGSGTPPGR